MVRLVDELRARWRAAVRGRDTDEEMEAEFRSHVELRAEELERAGVSAAEARRRARVEFGSVDRFREEGRGGRGLASLDELRADLRYAVRSLRRIPAFTLAATLTLALGVGANTAMFALVSSTLLRPLPFAEPDRLVALFGRQETDARRLPWSPGAARALETEWRVFSHVASRYADDMNVSDGVAAPMRARVELVSASYGPTLGVAMARGTWFSAEHERVVSPSVVLSHAVWQTRYGADPAIIGQSLNVNGVPLTVIGVAAPGFGGVDGAAELWVLHVMAPAVYMANYLENRQRFVSVVARLAPGVDAARARVEWTARAPRILEALRQPGDDVAAPDLLPLHDTMRDPAAVRAQLALAAAAAGVLLIAALNLSSLLLARGLARWRESAVRIALGAGRVRLLRQMIVEGAVIGVLAGIVGLALGAAGLRALAAQAPTGLLPAPVLLDWRTVAFTFGAAVVAAGLAALVAALRASRGDRTGELRSSARGHSVRVGSLRRPTLLTAAGVLQVACSLLLLVGAAVLVSGFRELDAIDPGFDATNVVAFTISPPDTRYSGEAAAPLLERVLTAVEAVPGVQHATVSLCTPYRQCSRTTLHMPGVPDDDDRIVGRHYVAARHFDVLGIRIVRGRALTERDRAGAPHVAVINETAAQRLWPGQDPIGRRVWFGSGGGFASPDALTEVVGVVADVLYGEPGSEIRPDFYTSYLQFTWPTTTVMVRTGLDAAAIVTALRDAVASVDPNLAIHDVRDLQQWSRTVLARQRFATLGLGTISALGLLLACLGIYGIMGWSVAQRRREIGIRLALGAPAAQIARMVLAQAGAIVAAGVVIGAAASLALTRVLRAMLPHASSPDLTLLALVVLLLVTVAGFACWRPAARAAAVDPAHVLGDA